EPEPFGSGRCRPRPLGIRLAQGVGRPILLGRGMMGARKGQIRDLLRAARARLDPAEFGLRGSGRRKVPGLRREDVAVLAQVSLKWYTWLEQGRELNFSEELLHRIARTLRLLPCEAAYLVAL